MGRRGEEYGRLLVGLLTLFCIATAATARQTLSVPNLPPTLKCKQSIADYLAGHKNMGITSRFISGHASASLFGRSPRGSLVFFAPTDAAWERAAIRLKIDLVGGSKEDGEAIAAVLLYNVLLEGQTSAPRLGTRAALLKKKSAQSALGTVAARKLPIHFTKRNKNVYYATGAVRGSSRLYTPAEICGSLVYRTSTVLLPTLDKTKVPLPIYYI